MRVNNLFLSICILLFATSCSQQDKEILGWAPIYDTNTNNAITSANQLYKNENPGKIYIKDNYFYQVDIGKAIHIYDISDVNSPTQIAILQIPGVQEISIKGSFLYTNSYNDLVKIDINELNSPKEVQRIPNTFNIIGNHQSPNENGYYECVDPSKGTVIGWEEKMLKNPKCRK